MSEFAKMLYKVGGLEMIGGVGYDYVVVANQEEQDEAEAEGWHTTTDAALTAKKGAEEYDRKEFVAGPDDAPTRAELEAKATELGLKFDGRTADKRLAVMIADEMKV